MMLNGIVVDQPGIPLSDVMMKELRAIATSSSAMRLAVAEIDRLAALEWQRAMFRKIIAEEQASRSKLEELCAASQKALAAVTEDTQWLRENLNKLAYMVSKSTDKKIAKLGKKLYEECWKRRLR